MESTEKSLLLLNQAIPFGIFEVLNLASIPSYDETKLSRYLWKFASDGEKVQKLIKWITIVLSVHHTKISDASVKDLLWKTLADFLSSNELQSYFTKNGKEIEIKSIFTDYFLKELSTSEDKKQLLCMVDVCRSLLLNQKLLNEFNLRFQTSTKLTASWLKILRKFLKEEPKSNFLHTLCDFVKLVVEKLSKTLQDVSIKNSTIHVARFVMIPALQIYEILSSQDEDWYPETTKILKAIEEIFKEAFFSGKMKPYVCDSGSSAVGKEDAFEGITGKLIHSSIFCFFVQLHNFALASQDNQHYLVTAYRLFLNISTTMMLKHKALFFLNLRAMLDSSCDFSHLYTYMKLFKLSASLGFQKLPVDSEMWKDLHDFHLNFIKMMIEENGTLTEEMIQCLGLVAEIDYPAIEENLGLTMKKILQKAKAEPNAVQSTTEFFRAAFHTTFSNRKPQVLIDRLIVHIVEEIARNRSETSNRHCVVICGIIGRIVSANCNAYLVQSVVLDIWKGFQEKAREIVPQTEKTKMENDDNVEATNEIVGKKRKLSQSKGSSKRIKLEKSHGDVLHCLLILLNNVLENVDFLELQTRVLSRQKITKLLIELRVLISDLTYCLSAVDDLTAQYYRLLVVVGHQELAATKYNPVKSDTDVTIKAENFSDWEVDINQGSSFYHQYYCKQWQCFKILKLSMKLQHLELEEVFLSESYEEIKKLLDENISLFLKLDDQILSSRSDAPWNQVPEYVNSPDLFCVAFLSVLQNCFAAVLAMSSDECLSELGNLFVHFYQPEYEGHKGHVTANSLIHDMLQSPLVSECSRFHQAFINALLEKVKANIKGSKRNKDVKILIKFAISSLRSTSNVQKSISSHILSVLSKDREKTSKGLRVAMKNAVEALLSLPYYSFAANQKLCYIVVFVCFLATCPDKYELHEKCCDAIAFVTGFKKDMYLLKHIPISVVLPYFIKRSHRYSAKGQIVIRKLLHKIYSSSSLEDILAVASSDSVLLSADSLISVTWMLECFCDVMKRHLKIFGCSKYALMPEEEENLFGDTNKAHLIVKVHSTKQKITVSDNEVKQLSKYCDFIGRVMEVCKEMLKNETDQNMKFELLKFLLLASFFIDLCPGKSEQRMKDLYQTSNLKAVLLNTLKSMKSEINLGNFISKTQLLLVYFEQLLTFKNDEKVTVDFTFMDLGLTWQDINDCIISAYGSQSIKESSFAQDLLDRLLFCLHMLIPSVKIFSDFASTCLNRLNASSISEDIESRFAYIKLVAASYNKETRSFSLIQAKKDAKLTALFSAFLNDAFHAVTQLIASMTSSLLNQSAIPILQGALSSLTKIASLAHILPERYIGEALTALERINLQFIYAEHIDYFIPLFSGHCKLLSSVLQFYQESIENVVPLVLSVCRKLNTIAVQVGRQSVGKGPELALECALMVDRINHFVATNFKTQFSRCIPFVIADFICEVGKEMIYPPAKKNLDNAMYHLVSLCSDEDIHVLNVTLPRDVQAIFQDFYEGYSKYFKYKGWV